MAKRFTRVILTTWLAVFVVLMLMANGQEEKNPDEQPDAPAAGAADQGEPQVTELIAGLRFPTAMAVRPSGGRDQVEVWVAECGESKVVRYHSGSSEGWSDAIVELSAPPEANGEENAEGQESEEEPSGAPIPAGLYFQSRNRLVLTHGGELPLRVFDIKDNGLPLKGGNADQLGEPKEAWAGGLAAVARNPDGLYFLGFGGERTNWIALAPIKGAEIGPIEKFRDATKGTDSDTPRAITFSSKGYLVIGLAGDEAGESRLVFLDPYRGESPPVMVLKTGLADINSLAYHPKSGSLYAADSSWSDAEKGGIYRLDAKSVEQGGNESCEAVLVANLPYAMAIDFDSEGNLYAVSAASPDGTGEPTGKLIKVTGQL